MSPRVTLGLLAVLLALGGYVYFGGGGEGGGSGAAAKPGAPGKPGAPATPDPALDLFRFDDREANRLVARRGDQQVTVEKGADGAWVLRPSGEPADRMRVSGLLLRFSNLRATRRIAEPANLADYGLAPPSGSVTLGVAGSPDLELVLGGRAPAESGTYAQKPGDPAVYVVSNALAQDVERLISEPPREPTPTPAPSPAPDATPTP